MTTLSRAEITKYASDAGFTGTTLNTMVAIAYAESGGNPKSHNTNAGTGDNSYGLWQINMIGSLGPSRRKAFGISSNDQLFDPATNAKAARTIFNSQGLGAWTTYTRGTYMKFMKADSADTGASESAPVSTDQYSGISGAIESVGKNVFQGVSNVGGILVAIALLIGGVTILLVTSKSGKNVVKAVGKVTP
jgi:hypothetical protein